MGLLKWIKSKIGRKEDKPIRAFVWLLDEPRMLDAPMLQRIVEQALDKTLAPGADVGGDFVVGEMPMFIVKLDLYMLMVNAIPAPYMKDPARAARAISERRLQKVVAEHRAWLSVDLMGDYDDEAEKAGWRIIGRIAAALADNRCLAILVPGVDRCLPFDPGLLDHLRSDDPLGALSWSVAPVVNISSEDPRMKGAVEEARLRWPEFVQAFREPDPGQEGFSVKLPVTDGKNTEYIWVQVDSIEGEVISGDLANEPVDLRFMRLGSRVRGSVADLNDWAYIENGDMVGGFTSRVLMG